MNTFDPFLPKEYQKKSDKFTEQLIKWNTVQTDQEQHDQQNVIRKLEAKLDRIKQNYSNIIPISDDEDDGQSFQDDDEGRALLETTSRRKTESEYYYPLCQWLNCCFHS
ncbi:hypothetical protein RMCBS344292_04846 [Rhizopus microsporus]|nr:hypothetical protein RMCBS344292_04846 [Rhizopus microsporus]